VKTHGVILTGLSGSGKTVALRAFEDCGYFCTDNLPSVLIDDFLKISSSSGISSFAIGIDIREKGFLSNIEETLIGLKKTYNIEIVFLEADKQTLIRRFKETKRPHPLIDGNSLDLQTSLEKEIVILKPLRDLAERVIDTTTFTPYQLRDHISSLYCAERSQDLNVTLTSFGYKYGIPPQADIILDVRFLPNPHYVPSLKDHTGLEKEVKDFVFSDGNGTKFLNKIKELLSFLIPLYIKEGKSYLNICIGCTGGKHRSVAVVEELEGCFTSFPIHIEKVHRDI